MTTASNGRSYEITVLGALGPALRAALEPCRTAPSGISTIARVTYQDDEDLIEVVRVLTALGLEVTNVTHVDGAVSSGPGDA